MPPASGFGFAGEVRGAAVPRGRPCKAQAYQLAVDDGSFRGFFFKGTVCGIWEKEGKCLRKWVIFA